MCVLCVCVRGVHFAVSDDTAPKLLITIHLCHIHIRFTFDCNPIAMQLRFHYQTEHLHSAQHSKFEIQHSRFPTTTPAHQSRWHFELWQLSLSDTHSLHGVGLLKRGGGVESRLVARVVKCGRVRWSVERAPKQSLCGQFCAHLAGRDRN